MAVSGVVRIGTGSEKISPSFAVCLYVLSRSKTMQLVSHQFEISGSGGFGANACQGTL